MLQDKSVSESRIFRDSVLSLISKLAWGALISLILGTAAAWGQESSISGLVTDPSGSAVPNAKVELISVDQGWYRTAVSNPSGFYSFFSLRNGRYELRVAKEHFQPLVRSNIALDVATELRVDLPLQVGNVSQTVTVDAASPILDTQTANKEITLSNKEVLALPIPARSPTQAVFAQAGVVSVRQGINSDNTVGDHNEMRFALNGGRDEQTAILVDGVSVTSGDVGQAILLPGIEATQEVQVIGNAFDAQYGKTDGGVVRLATRAGTSKFHGSLYEYLRNSALDANSWTNNRAGLAKPDFHRSQFGAVSSGPLFPHTHMFFFGAYEGIRETTPSTLITTVPTAAQRQGDFSETYNSDGSLATIYNPFTTVAQANGQYTRTPFPGNKIPSGLMDPVGLKVLNLFPQPTSQGDAITHANNYAVTRTAETVTDRMDARIDWTRSDKYSLFGHVTKVWSSIGAPAFLGGGVDTNYTRYDPGYLATLGNTFILSPTWVVNVNIGSIRWNQQEITPSQVANINGTAVGLPASLVGQFAANTLPKFSFENYQQLGNPLYLKLPRQNLDIQAGSTKQVDRHSIDSGFAFESAQLNDTTETSAIFNLNRGLTSGPIAATDSSTSGNAIASLLLGTMASANAPYTAATATTQKYAAWYLQDSWQATHRLALHYGVRYEVQFPRTERYNKLNNFNPEVQNPLSSATGLNLVGGLTFLGPSRRGLWDTDYKNVAPRVALAYRASNKLVFRAGYGIFYVQTVTSTQGPTDGFSANTTAVTTQGNAGFVPANLLSNPFPDGLLKPTGNSLGLLTDVGTTLYASFRHHPTPYVQSYNANIQLEIAPNSVFELGYQGTQGRHLAIGYGQSQQSNEADINQLDPAYLSLGSKLNQQVSNPFRGVIPSGNLAGSTIAYNQLLRPYPQYTNVYLDGDTPAASSSFNALTAKLIKKTGSGLFVLLTYQWSKAIDNTSETQGWEIGDEPRNIYDLSVERSISAHDDPQYFTGSLIWELPVGRGRAIGGEMNRLVNVVVGNWQLSSIVNFASGLPLQFSCANTLAVYGFKVCRPNVAKVGQLAISHPSPRQWFNTSSSVIAAPPPYTIGSIPRYLPNIRFAPLRRGDLTLRKSFPWKDRWVATFQMSAYNFTNTPEYGRADTNVSSPTFGQITTLAPGSLPRNIEAALRFDF